MADQLGVLAFGGPIRVGSSTSDAIVEEWECTLSFRMFNSTKFNQATCDNLWDIVATWIQAADAHIASNVFLDFVKWNEFDFTTGHQISDPTIEHLSTGIHGISASSLPYTCSYRVSLDNGTRNPRARGGFYAPRPSLSVGADGRFSGGNVGALVLAAATLLTDLNTEIGSANGILGVWSRRDHAVHDSTRFRIGDVPDNVRRRKNALPENYTVSTL